MALYEHVFLARQDVSNAQVEALTKEFTDLIEQGGGKVTKSEYWGVKGLAYKIKKSRKAHFSLLNIDAPPAAVAFPHYQSRSARDRAFGDDAQERSRRARRPW
jgi:small subunit ribosomal protein S6